ncbi:uncharacterized protein, partial [Nerophis lumbriciformis]|uniref:uncharacterized protein n=1 Tax=Nerophis lumbriciformis TaxID=546530 RepID=UPI002AE01C74
MLDAMEEFAPSSDSDCTAVPPPGQASPGRCRRRPVAVKRAGRREFTPSSESDCIAVPPPGQASPGMRRRRPVAVRRAGRREQVGVTVFPLHFQLPAVCGEPTVIREEPAVQEETQVPLQVSTDKVASFPLPSDSGTVSVSEPQSVCGRVAMVARDCRGIRLTKVVRGSFHQGESRFSYGGMQCMAIAASSIAKHVVKSVFSWETQELDRILYSGDDFYSRLRNLGIFSHPSHFLSVPDLPSNVLIDEQLFSFHFSQHPASGALGVEQENGPFVTLRNGLEGIFSQYSMCLLTLVTSTSAIICEDGQFAVVDSHSRSSCGLVDHNGTSVILHFSCLDDLHHYICCLADALSPGLKPFELCGVRVSVGASPALSGASVESCIFEMNTTAAPELTDIKDVCATTSLFESDAGPAVSHAQSGVSVESGFIEMSTASAPGFSDLAKNSAAPSVCHSGNGVEASPALSGASVLTFLSEVSSGSTAEFVASDGKKRKIFSRERMSKQSKRFDSNIDNSDVVFITASESGKLFFRPLGEDVCRALCSQLKVHFVKVGGLVHREVGYLGVPCLSEKIVPDGNCFFRAVSQAVSGSQKNHRKIRLAACRELEKNEARYRGLLRSEMSLLQYIKQSRMKCVNTWATEVEIQATADYLGIDIFTFHDGRWLKYRCSSKCLSADCIYLENVGGQHFEYVVCVLKPGLHSCHGYCKLGWDIGCSTRSSVKDGAEHPYQESTPGRLGDVQEEAQVPLQVFIDKVAFFPPPSGSVSEPQSVCGRVAMGARDCRGIRLSKVVRGSFHQGDSRFSYGGMQCMAIAASSIAKHVVKSVFSWERQELDRILYSGDEFYSSLRNLGIFSHPSHFLSVPDLPTNVVIDEQLFSFHFSQHPASGAVGVEQENGPFVTLRNGLEGIFSQYSMCLLTLVTSTSAIICEDGQFAVVDSHSRSSCGLVDHNGTSVILHFSCLDDLHHYICCLADALSRGPKPFELCGVRVSVAASPALSGASVESCIFEMNTAAAPKLSDINVCATTSLFESDAGPAVSHAQSGVPVESGFIEMSTAPAPGFSNLDKDFAAPSVCQTGAGVEASPALSGASVLTLSEVSSGSTAAFVATDGKKRLFFSGERMSKQSKRFDSVLVNSDVVFVSASESDKLFFRPLGDDVCRALCSQLKVDFMKVGGLVHREVCYLGVPCLSEKIVPDGNCFFRAVSQAVSGSQKNHRKIRLAACRELENNEAKYRGLLRSEMSLLEYIKQSRMKCVKTWATEVEIQATANYLGIDIFSFHDGRWLKYRCSSKCLSADCIYLENVGGQHFESVVCVLKPGLQSCHGYCKLGRDIGRSTRSSLKNGAGLAVDGIDCKGKDFIEVVEGSTISRDSSATKYLKRKKRLQDTFNFNRRERRALLYRKMYSDDLKFRESYTSRSVDKYRYSFEHRQRVKARTVGKYRENLGHRIMVKKRSVARYRADIEHRQRVKYGSKVASKTKYINLEYKAKVKARSVAKYSDNIAHRYCVKARSVAKYSDNIAHRYCVKARSVAKYSDNIAHRYCVKARSIAKYSTNIAHRERVKFGSKVASKIKYMDNLEHRQRVKLGSKRQYSVSLKHRQQVIASVQLSRKQRLERSVDFGFVMDSFLDKVRHGPDFVCSVCHRLQFKYQVLRCEREVYAARLATAGIANNCISEHYLHSCDDKCVEPCPIVESRGQLWICFTCHSKISKGQFPAECWNNNLAVHPIPPELGCLNSLEQHLIALRIPFMKALALPKGGQNGVHGPVTCVPANIVQTTNVLPRSSTEGSLLQVKLKRKLTYKGHYEYQFVDSWRVRRAIEYLKRTNVLYKDIEFNVEWLNDFCREEEVVEAGQGKQVVVDTQSSEDEAVEQDIGVEEESEDIAQDEMLHDRQQHCMFQDTCLMPVDIGQEALDQYFADVVCLAPAEGNSPVRMLSDKLNEAKCFPVLFPTSTNTFHTRRTHRLTLSRYFNNRVMHADGRFARNVEYIFFSQYMSELDKVISSISVAMRKGKGGQHSQRISPGMLKDDESLKRLLQFDDGFRFLRPIRGTPAFWSSVQKDLLACVRQLGIPTWFCSFSSADLRWQNLLASILRQEGRQQTVEQLEWADRCELLRRNPVTAARMFDYRWHCFLKEVLMSPSQPVGKIVDFFYRIEFQQRGSPHVHALFWIEGAPQIYKNTDVEVAEFVDKYVTCELPSGDDTLLEVVSSVQTHSKRHSKSCRKNKTVCRFNFPKPISARTFICKIKECVCPKKGTGTEGDRTSENRPKCTCFDDEGRKMPKEVAKMFMERVKNAMGREEPFGSVEELFASVGINQEVFELAYRRLETKNKVVYRRGVNDTWVNQYNRNLLKCWNANMDISFVTDAYAVIIYIIKYITKSETEMGLLLSNALKEANKLGNLSAKDALKKLGSVYLHNRDVCAQEAVYRLMSMHLKECSRKVVFIPTGNNIVRMSLPLSVLLQRASSEGLRSENMWMTSIVERYKNRPDSVVFEDMCIATFCSEYRILTQNENPDNKIELQGGLGFVLRRTRTQFAVVRYMRFKLDKQEEAHFQSLLQLFLPYRTDLELKPEGFEFYKQFHEEGNVTSAGGTERPVRDVVDENRAKFEVDCPRLERAQEIADMLGGVDEDAWGDLCPEQQVEHMECLEERRQQQQGEIRDEQLVELEENVPDLFVGGKQVATIERNTNILPRREGLALVHSLNETQRSIFDRIRKWCLEKVMGKTPEPFHVFVTGGAGTGKSHLIRAIQYEAGRLLSRLYQPDETCVLLTAPTGIAAYSLHAATIHHTFSIGMQVSLPYIPLGEDKINSLRAQFGHLQILIIDEISMVDHHLLAYVHGRLRQIKQTGDFSPFGNVSVVAVGDFYQLPPVKGRPLYTCQVGVDLWCHFTKVELKTVVRQKDSVFSELLNRLRVRSKETPLSQSDVDILKSRETGEQSAALHIYPTNMQASEHNLKRLFATCPDYVTIEAQDFINSRKTGELERVVGHHGKTSYTCLAKSLCLAPEARVMLCKNVAVADGLVNGACGTVTYIQFGADEDFPLVVYVKFDDPKIGSQRRKERSHAAVECPHSTAIDPVEDSATKRGGLRRQFPLKLAWACTVHKVQGLTVDEAVVCLHKIFAAGQAYVALSRVRDISGLVITDFEEKAIYCKHTVKGALDSMPPFLLEHPQPSLETPCFSVYLLNVQNLRSHVAHLVSCTQHLQPTCIAVTETWLSAQSSTDCVQIEGYTFHSRPRALCYSSNDVKLSEIRDLEHGGVGLYVVDNSDCEILQVPDLNLECLVCLFTKESLLMAVIYRPPCYPISLFKSNLVKLLDCVNPISNTIAIMGDFNEDLLKHSSISKLMGQNGFCQHVTQETTESGTLIDHVYVKTTQYAVDCAVVSTYFSDHEAILCGFR